MPIRDNKFARQSQGRLQKNAAARDNQPTVEEQLARLEEDIRRLKVEFDIFFNGASKRPPYDTKGRVETLIKRIADDRSLNYGQRYHYNSLVARYTSFRELWRRTMQGREETRGAVTKAPPRAEVGARETYATFVCTDPHRDVPIVKGLYEALVEAKRRCNEPTDDLSFPRFHHLIATKADAIKEHSGCERVRFSIDIENGHVSFKARADNDL